MARVAKWPYLLMASSNVRWILPAAADAAFPHILLTPHLDDRSHFLNNDCRSFENEPSPIPGAPLK